MLDEIARPDLQDAANAMDSALKAYIAKSRYFATQRLIEQAHPVAALFKPVDERTLFDAITRALALSKNESRDA